MFLIRRMNILLRLTNKHLVSYEVDWLMSHARLRIALSYSSTRNSMGSFRIRSYSMTEVEGALFGVLRNS